MRKEETHAPPTQGRHIIQLSSGDLARVARASQILLAPLDHGSLDAWRAAVNDNLRELLGADSAGFLLPVTDAAPMFSNEHSAETLAPFPGLIPPPLADGTPIWRRMIDAGTGTLEAMYGADMHTYLASEYYNDFAAIGGGAETLATTMAVTGDGACPAGAASLHFWHAKPLRRRFRPRDVAILSLLHPSFRSGVESWQRFAAHRATFLRTIDRLDQAVAVYDVLGCMAHTTPALDRILADDADRATVNASMMRLARNVRLSPDIEARCGAREEVRTRVARYTLNCCTHANPGDSAPLMLVSLTRETARRRSDAELRAAFSLTAAETAIARLIADGLRNAAIAVTLTISEHTAKRHTERVLLKLRVKSRSEVAATLAR